MRKGMGGGKSEGRERKWISLNFIATFRGRDGPNRCSRRPSHLKQVKSKGRQQIFPSIFMTNLLSKRQEPWLLLTMKHVDILHTQRSKPPDSLRRDCSRHHDKGCSS